MSTRKAKYEQNTEARKQVSLVHVRRQGRNKNKSVPAISHYSQFLKLPGSSAKA